MGKARKPKSGNKDSMDVLIESLRGCFEGQNLSEIREQAHRDKHQPEKEPTRAKKAKSPD